MNRNNKDKKLALLALIKRKRTVLLGSVHNNEVTKQEKEEAWLTILKWAQTLGLASGERPWNYARDHLFGLWKSRALAKRSNIRKIDNLGRRKAVKFDEVDKAILDIVGKELPDTNKEYALVQPETAAPPSLVKEELPFPIENRVIKTEPLPIETYETEEVIVPKINTRQKRVTKRKPKCNYTCTVEDVKRQVLESELYCNKLKILKLEQELGLPPSKFTEEFHNTSVSSESSDFIH